MCLLNRQGRTNSKNLASYRPYHIGYKCGHCEECVREKRNEWLLRSFFESKDTIDKGGYILFDTLTYDDEHIPTIKRYYSWIKKEDDFSCFSYEDIRKFTNNLWVAINRLPCMEDYDVKQNVKFFLVSEYGHENIYVDERGRTRKGTMRPHYHVLFYIKDKRLQPGVLSYLIWKIWKRGETDNHRNGLFYMKQKNVIGKGYTKDKVKNVIAVSNYVSKYITKQADYMEKVEQRIDATVERLICCERDFTYSDKNVAELGDIDFQVYWNKRKEVVQYISPFHRQSRGFGECALYNGFNAFEYKGHSDVLDEILENLQITIPDSRFVTKTYSVPLYFTRKLFYRTFMDDEGKYHWVLNDLGKEKYAFIMQKKCDNVADRLIQWYINLNPQVSCFSLNVSQNLYVSCVDYLLDGRTMNDLAEYMVYYRGRIFDKDAEFVDEETGEISSIPTIEQIIEFDKNYSPLIDTGIYNNGCNIIHKVDLRNVGADDSDDEFDSMIDDFFTSLYGEDWYDDTMDESYKSFECTSVINEETDYRFRNFDTLINMYYLSMSKSAVGKQAYFDLVEQLSKKLKG